MEHPVEGRRSFLAWVVTGLGAVFGAILGVPIVAYLIDPRHRHGAGGDFRVVDGVPLDTGLEPYRPVQGVLRAVRRDGWTLHPNDVVGRVWVVAKGPIPNRPVENDASVLEVFTTICPHLGCSVNLNADPSTGFACPCHGAEFNPDGTRKNPATNPAQRGLDALQWKIEVDPDNPARKRLLVRYQNFKSSIADKVVV